MRWIGAGLRIAAEVWLGPVPETWIAGDLPYRPPAVAHKAGGMGHKEAASANNRSFHRLRRLPRNVRFIPADSAGSLANAVTARQYASERTSRGSGHPQRLPSDYHPAAICLQV